MRGNTDLGFGNSISHSGFLYFAKFEFNPEPRSAQFWKLNDRLSLHLIACTIWKLAFTFMAFFNIYHFKPHLSSNPSRYLSKSIDLLSSNSCTDVFLVSASLEQLLVSGQGFAQGYKTPFAPMPRLFYSPRPDHILKESYQIAEEEATDVIECFHPTEESEELRRQVIQYLQQLLRSRLSCQVFPYGSVPLRTYLPDGDIDLTVVSTNSDQEAMAQQVRAILEEEEKNEAAMFRVKNVIFIPAQVKLVKCIVQDIAIDISFNQLGGLCALCFLEEVDRYVGRDHLFKLSLLLIKSWCFYESRVLGSFRGFLSTYALEIMVLYIFRLYSRSISGPLMALHIFLDYFSQFDWGNYGITLRGPVNIPLLAMPNVYKLASGNFDEFLSRCMDTYAVPLKDVASDSRMFKFNIMNIVDPLQPYNNLGRSVNPESSWTIRLALANGAHKLRSILLLPRDRIACEVRNFLTRGMQRHAGDAAETDSAENQEVWQTLLGLAGDHAGNVSSLVEAHSILQQNASSSNGNSSQRRGKENVTENCCQGKSVTQRNGHAEEGLVRPSKSDSAQFSDGSVYDAGLLPKIQFGSFGDSLEVRVQPESKQR